MLLPVQSNACPRCYLLLPAAVTAAACCCCCLPPLLLLLHAPPAAAAFSPCCCCMPPPCCLPAYLYLINLPVCRSARLCLSGGWLSMLSALTQTWPWSSRWGGDGCRGVVVAVGVGLSLHCLPNCRIGHVNHQLEMKSQPSRLACTLGRLAHRRVCVPVCACVCLCVPV